ncbi:MAG: XdhC family protein [Treponema sp.]|nr:XdhC family protein [Treponema sp.]
MNELFTALREEFAEKKPLVLVLLIAASGSTPRDAGAWMLVGREGRIRGTIGGAIPEHLAIEEARSIASQGGGGAIKNYLLHENEAADLGAKCGGELSVFFQYITSETPGLIDFIEKGISRRAVKEAAWFIMGVSPEADNSLSFCLAAESGLVAALGAVPAALQPLLTGRPVLLEQNARRWFSAPLAAAGFVYVFGGGHVAQELVPLLTRLEFRCVVFDDREEFTRRELFPGAANIIRGEFDKIEKYLSLESGDYAVIVTRGHIWDYDAFTFALHSRAAYIGVIGSRAKHAFVREKLIQAGCTAAEIDAPRVHAPIGVDIKSKSPAEVAVSIAAELIRVRAGGQGSTD